MAARTPAELFRVHSLIVLKLVGVCTVVCGYLCCSTSHSVSSVCVCAAANSASHCCETNFHKIQTCDLAVKSMVCIWCWAYALSSAVFLWSFCFRLRHSE